MQIERIKSEITAKISIRQKSYLRTFSLSTFSLFCDKTQRFCTLALYYISILKQKVQIPSCKE